MDRPRDTSPDGTGERLQDGNGVVNAAPREGNKRSQKSQPSVADAKGTSSGYATATPSAPEVSLTLVDMGF